MGNLENIEKRVSAKLKDCKKEENTLLNKRDTLDLDVTKTEGKLIEALEKNNEEEYAKINTSVIMKRRQLADVVERLKNPICEQSIIKGFMNETRKEAHEQIKECYSNIADNIDSICKMLDVIDEVNQKSLDIQTMLVDMADEYSNIKIKRYLTHTVPEPIKNISSKSRGYILNALDNLFDLDNFVS